MHDQSPGADQGPDSIHSIPAKYLWTDYHHHHHWAAVVSRGWAKASACRLQMILPCLVLSSAISCRSSICLGRLSTAWLVSLVVFSCHMLPDRQFLTFYNVTRCVSTAD